MEELKGLPKEDTQSKLVDDNIIKSNNSTFDKGNKSSDKLTSKEKSKLTDVFGLFNKLFFEYQKKTNDEKQKTLISEVSQKQKNLGLTKGPDDKLKGFSWLALLVGGVALVAAAIPTLIAALFEKIGPLADSLKVLGKLGLVGGLKMMAKTFLKVFAAPVLKRLPIIGSLINFYFAYKEFKAGRIAAGVLELVGGIANFVPGVGTMLSIGVDILKGFLDSKGAFDEGGMLSNENALGTILSWGKSIGNWIWDNALGIPILGGIKRFGMAYDSFSSGQYGEGIKQILLGILSFTPIAPLVRGAEILLGFLSGAYEKTPEELKQDTSWSGRMLSWVREKLDVLPWWIKKPLSWFGIIPDDQVGEPPSIWTNTTDAVSQGFNKTKEFIGGIWDKVKGPMGDSVETIKSFAVDTWKKTKDFASSAWNVVEEQAPKIWDGIKSASEKALELSKTIGSSLYDGILSIVDKTRNFISEWAPKIVESIANIANSAYDTLKSIATKIGGWISNLFTKEEEQKLKEIKTDITITPSVVSDQSSKWFNILSMAANTSNQWLENLYQASREEITYLASIDKNTRDMVKALLGNGRGGNTTVVNNSGGSEPTSVERPRASVGNNRVGYSMSPYTLA